MAAHARLKNEFTEDEKCHNVMSWLILCDFVAFKGSPFQTLLIKIYLTCLIGGYCGAPPHIANGYIVSATGVQGGDTAAYECDSGFSANTSMVIRCNANDTWDMAPNCTCMFCII